MAVTEIYSKRQRRLRGEFPDVYTYEELPDQLRIQITQIIDDAIGTVRNINSEQNYPWKIYSDANKILCREYGIERLTSHDYSKKSLFEFIKGGRFEGAMDAIELLFQAINSFIRENPERYKNNATVNTDPDSAIEELNARFKEHGIGYQFESGEIIRVDSTFIHSEVVKPLLKLLSNPIFESVNEEYLGAHEHYRHGNNEEAMVDCLKAFESCMMIICDTQGWGYPKTITANGLIQLLFDKKLIPDYLDAQFNSLKGILASGVPTLRNKNGGHGQGPNRKTVPDYMARYTLNLTGSNIIFLIELNSTYNNEN